MNQYEEASTLEIIGDEQKKSETGEAVVNDNENATLRSEAAQLMGRSQSSTKGEAARLNGRKGGRPKGWVVNEATRERMKAAQQRRRNGESTGDNSTPECE